MATPEKLEDARRIAVFRALPGLGDLLCAVPALRALRRACPNARITLIGLPQARFLLERYPDYVDEILDFPGWPGLPERQVDAATLPIFLSSVQARRFDLLLQMHGSGLVTNPLIALLAAKRSAGFYLPGQFCPDETSYLPYPAADAEPRRLLRLLDFLGLPPQGEHLEFPLRASDHAALRDLPEARELVDQPYVCLHPGASLAARRWPVQHFAAVADALAARGLRVVLTGSAEEAALTRAVAGAMRQSALDLAGRTSLGALAALLSAARLLVCNDTGVSHLAAALGLRSVVIFLVTAPQRWAPLDRHRHRIVGQPLLMGDEDQSACQRCLRDGCRADGAPLRAEASVAAALAQVNDLLQEGSAHVAC